VYQQVSAFVLHSRPYKETSALVTFFCAERGKFNAIVRGVRGSKKAHLKAALLQPFQELDLSWKEKAHSDLVSLQNIENGKMRLPLEGQSAVCAMYINELMYRLLYPNVTFDNLYQDYADALLYLTQLQLQDGEVQGFKQAQILRWFELRLLNVLGHGFTLEEDLSGHEIKANENYLFYPEFGFELIEGDWQLSHHSFQVSGACILSLQELLIVPVEEIEIAKACAKTLRQLLSIALQPFLGKKPIAAKTLLQKPSGKLNRNN
jgi:DNA repair protein RecO (recombination protein O)